MDWGNKLAHNSKNIVYFFNRWLCGDREWEDNSHFLLWCFLSGSLCFLLKLFLRKDCLGDKLEHCVSVRGSGLGKLQTATSESI